MEIQFGFHVYNAPYAKKNSVKKFKRNISHIYLHNANRASAQWLTTRVQFPELTRDA
jgi:hypothetical protein